MRRLISTKSNRNLRNILHLTCRHLQKHLEVATAAIAVVLNFIVNVLPPDFTVSRAVVTVIHVKIQINTKVKDTKLWLRLLKGHRMLLELKLEVSKWSR